MKKIVILGGGISGLASAWFLKAAFPSAHLTLIEKSTRLGGWIDTFEQDGFLFEAGPRGFRPSGKGAMTLQLAKDLGLEKDLVYAPRLKRYLKLDSGKLRPLSLLFLLQKGLLKGFKPLPPLPEDLSVWSFFERRFGKTFADTFITPFVQGIYGGSARELSALSCFPKLYQWEKEGSLLKECFLATFRSKAKVKAPLCSFKKGMRQLPDRLSAVIQAEIHLSTSVTNIKGRRVETTSGSIDADLIVYAMPPSAIPWVFQTLEPLPFLTLSTVHVGFEGSQLPYRGFGYLSPLEEKEGFLGMTWDSEIFPGQNRGEQTRLTLLFRGKTPSCWEKYLKEINFSKAPKTIAFREASYAIPQCLVGHEKRLKSLSSPPVFFIGPSFSGPGVNDCIFRAQQISQNCF